MVNQEHNCGIRDHMTIKKESTIINGQLKTRFSFSDEEDNMWYHIYTDS